MVTVVVGLLPLDDAGRVTRARVSKTVMSSVLATRLGLIASPRLPSLSQLRKTKKIQLFDPAARKVR